KSRNMRLVFVLTSWGLVSCSICASTGIHLPSKLSTMQGPMPWPRANVSQAACATSKNSNCPADSVLALALEPAVNNGEDARNEKECCERCKEQAANNGAT